MIANLMGNKTAKERVEESKGMACKRKYTAEEPRQIHVWYIDQQHEEEVTRVQIRDTTISFFGSDQEMCAGDTNRQGADRAVQ